MPATLRRSGIEPALLRRLLGLAAAVFPVASAATAAPGALSGSVAPHLQRATVTAAVAAGAGWIARDINANGAIVDAVSHEPSAGDTADAILPSSPQVRAPIKSRPRRSGSSTISARTSPLKAAPQIPAHSGSSSLPRLQLAQTRCISVAKPARTTWLQGSARWNT